MKRIKQMNNTLFDAASPVLIIGFFGALLILPIIIALTVWAVRKIKEIREINKSREKMMKARSHQNNGPEENQNNHR